MTREDLMKDYVPVNERVEAFLTKYPDGSLQSEVVAMTDTVIAMKAYAYRSPDDPRPGIGHSSIEVPGKTPYTRGSEMENCETSAWGRAIAALGFEVKRGIASAEEVRNKAPHPPRPAPERPTTPAPTPDAPSLSGDDWAGLVGEAPIPLPLTGDGLSSRDFFDRIDKAQIDRKDATNVAKRMFGQSKWKILDLSDEERAALWAELAPVPA